MISLQIPDYRIVRKLGSGAMGTVYEAEHLKLARRVAIKVVRPEHARDPALEARFVNEARALARVRHPSIVLIFEFGVLPDGTAYLVMEYLQGENLEARWQKQQRTATPLTELPLVHQLAQALALLHSRGVVHRDLKPANVMVVSEPGQAPQSRAKLVDFGLAKLIRLSGSKTASSLIMGTPQYMSPEQCRGAGQVGAKTDCYALGVMLYELIAGILPFESAWAGDLIGMHLRVEPPPLIKLEPNVDPRLATLIHALLRKDQLRRPAMADVAKYLGALIDELSQNRNQPLPSIEPEVDPFEVTRAPGAVVLAPPALPPDAAAPAPATQAQRPQARGPILGSRALRAGLLVGILLIAAVSLVPSLAKKQKRPNLDSLRDEQIVLMINPSLDNRIQLLSARDLGNQIEPVAARSPSIDLSALGKDDADIAAAKPDELSAPEREGDSAAAPTLNPHPALPEEVSRRLPCHNITGTYQSCIQSDGSVRTVKPLISIPGADRVIMQTLWGWRYPTRSTERCITVPVAFQVESRLGTCTNYSLEPPLPVQVPPDWLAASAPGDSPKLSWPSGLKPLRRCETKRTSYKVYVDASGAVSNVVPMDGLFKKDAAGSKQAIAYLAQQRYGPLAFPVYAIYTFTFQGSGSPRDCRSR